MTALATAIEKVKQQVIDELGSLKPGARAKKIKQIGRQSERDVEAVRANLIAKGEKDESVWQREIAAAEARYWAAMELYRDDFPDASEE